MKAIKLFLFMQLLAAVSGLKAQTAQPGEYYLLIGTYSSEGKPNGIHVYRFNTQSGDFKMARPVTELANASYLAISEDRRNVYAVSEGNGGTIDAYTFDPGSGALTFLNSVPAQGPCYVSVDDNKKLVFAANYGGGSVLSIHLNADGSFAEDKVQTIQHEGSSIVKGRQDGPHVHSVVLSPDNRFLLTPDLGLDRIFQYRVDASETKALTPAGVPFLQIEPGGGPRHLTFHPNGKYAYLVLELRGEVVALDYRDGKLETKQTASMVTPDYKGRMSGADIHVSPDGKFLYASNRAEVNEIAIYSIGKQGKIRLIGRQSTMGKTPRNFAIDPSGNFLLAANQDTNEIIIFRRDKKTGLLTPTGKKIEVDKPVCLKFAAIGR
jgi:6-phosphogluconolactonase